MWRAAGACDGRSRVEGIVAGGEAADAGPEGEEEEVSSGAIARGHDGEGRLEAGDDVPEMGCEGLH